MLRGTWLAETQLREMRDELVDSFVPSTIERAWPASLILLGLFLLVRRLI
jgi:hypothetical protein